jgi:tetratricopeptide (TPR) repeat protein
MNKLLIVLLFLTILIGCSQQSQPNLNKEQARNYANELYNRQLFKQSAAEYERYLTTYQLDNDEQANISYHLGDIYFERLRDYENALAYYIRVKYVHPKEELAREVDKKIVACLERLQRPEDAKQTLTESTSLEPEKVETKRPGAVIARIGTREITQGDIDFELNQLPPSIKAQYSDKAKKLEFLQQYILTELLYDSAKRQGLENDKEVVEAAFQAKRSLMVQKLLQDQISTRVNIVPSDVELYYQANKDKYVEKDDKGNVVREKPFDEVQKQATQDLYMKKQQEAYEELAQKLMRAENVQIYNDVLK